MNNNRKQKVFSMLDSLTSTEIEQYIKDRNLKCKELVEKLNRIKDLKPQNHFSKILQNINNKYSNNIQSYMKLGQAWIIAFILECFYDDKYKVKDIQLYIKSILKTDDELKEYVYDCMKDF